MPHAAILLKWRTPAVLTFRILLTLVLMFWVWFAVSVGVSEGAPSVLPVTTFVAACLALAGAAWRWATAGGGLLVGAAVVAAVVFPGGSALWMLAAPLGGAGLALLLLSRGGRR